MIFRKWRESAASVEADGNVYEDDHTYLYTLCTVWPEGPMSQAYMKNPISGRVPHVAAEIRKAIESSLYASFELGQDQIAFCRRLEATLELESA